MSILDNNILEATNIKNYNFPRYCDFDYNLQAYVWETQYYGDTIIKDGIQIGIHDEFYDFYGNGARIEHYYYIYIYIGTYDDIKPWQGFIKVSDMFKSKENARKWAYELLCFIREYRDFFEVLQSKYDYELESLYRISKPISIEEIYNFKPNNTLHYKHINEFD